MIFVSVADKRNKEKDVCVQLKLPVEKIAIRSALWETGAACADDFVILEVRCNIDNINLFLQKQKNQYVDVLLLNYLANILDYLNKEEQPLCVSKELSQFKDINEVISWFQQEALI